MAHSFVETCHTNQSAATTPWSSWTFAKTLRSVRDGLRQGLAAHRQYEDQRSRGISHDTALRRAFGILQRSSQD